LAVYWVGLFILAHRPIPKAVQEADVSDKSLHFLAYLILVFLLWFAVSDGRKVRWRGATPWYLFLTIMTYAIVDEWLQKYVAGRSCDVWDFVADLVSTTTGLALFSVFSFWPAGLVVITVTVFGVASVSKTDLSETLPAASAAFHLFAYMALTAFWIQCLGLLTPRRRLRPNGAKWFAAALAVPMALVVIICLFSAISRRGFEARDVIISTVGVAAVVVGTFRASGLGKTDEAATRDLDSW